jgi:hypothetical protein
MAEEGLAPERVWKVGPGLRVFCVFAGVGCVGAMAEAVVQQGALAGLASGVIFVPLVVFFWRIGIYPSLECDAAGVTARNPLKRWVVPWSEIAGCVPGYNGLVLTLRSGGTVTAWAVQKPNWASWMRREVRADTVALYVEQRALAARDHA